MGNFLKYCKNNKKKVFNIVIILIVFLYIFLNRCFGFFNLIESKSINNIIQIIMILAIFILTIKVQKLTIDKEKVKEIAQKCREAFNKYILVKAIVILLVVKILEKLVEFIVN